MLNSRDKKMDQDKSIDKKGCYEMNSIVQEASSIAKAIQQAWDKAGKPTNFSVRIFEKPEKNFLGMVSKFAKIALLFEKRDVQQPQKATARPRQQFTKSKPQPKPQQQSQRDPQRQEKKEQPTKQRNQKQPWTDNMVSVAQSWMENILKEMNRSDLKFSVEKKRYHLKFVFSSPVADEQEKQKNIFRNFAHLIMQTVRNEEKKQFRYHKVVITSE